MSTNDTIWLLQRPPLVRMAINLSASLDTLELLCSPDGSSAYDNPIAHHHSETNGAVADACHLGSGNFGSVYLGRLTLKKATLQLYKGTPTKSRSERDCRFFPPEEDVKRSLVAVKRLDEADMEAVMRESCSLELVADSCNVVKVFGPARVTALQGACCIVMDYVDGKSLNHFLKIRGRNYLRSGHPTSSSSSPCGCFDESCGNMSIFCHSESLWWKVKIEIFRELVIGLLRCHNQKLFHGDLKGENVLIDRCLIPKIIDFGMSFRKEDLSYYRDACHGGSLFWVSPEILTAEDVKEDPYPSDVYSLGMILVEMSMNGEVPTEFSDSFVNFEKLMDSPIPLQENDDLEELKEFYRMLRAIVDKCCFATREERCSLQDCLSDVTEAYKEICIVCDKIPHSCAHKGLWDPFCHDDFSFTASEKYQNLLKIDIRQMLPHVPDCVLLQPSKNMMVDMEGRLLIHYFCIVDYLDGVEYMMKHETRQFNHDMDIPYMALICVRAGSISVMRMLAKRWKAILAQQHMLVHEICESCVVNKQTDYVDMFRLLLFELGLEYDTWYHSFPVSDYDTKKPIDKLAITKKTDMIQVILDRASMDGNVEYIDTAVGIERALTYAVSVDNLETVLFLISQGAGRDSGSNLYIELFRDALMKGSARVATWLLRNAPKQRLRRRWDGTINEHTSSLAKFQHDPDFERNLAVLETHMNLMQLDGRMESHSVLLTSKEQQKAFECLAWKHMKLLQLDSRMESHPVLLACSKERQHAFECLAWLGVLRHTEEVVPLVCERGTVVMLKLLLDVGLDLEAHGPKLLSRAIQFNNEEVSQFIQAKCNNSTLDAGLPSVLRATSEPHAIKKPSNVGQKEEEACDQDYELDQLCKAIADNDGVRLASELRACKKSVTKEIMEKLALCCCENKNVELLRLLQAEGLDIKEASDKLGFLQRAVSSWEIVKYILEKGASVDLRDSVSNATPLMYAAAGHLSVMKLLLSAGANVELRDISECTAMDRALMSRVFKCVKELICHGFNLHMLDKDGVDYLTRVTQELRDHDDYWKILKEALFIKHISISKGTGTPGANVMQEHLLQLDDNILKKLASCFCEMGDVKMLRVLEEQGNVDMREASAEENLLHTAAEFARVDVIRYLLEKGIAVDCKRQYMQMTPLQVAAERQVVDRIAEETMAVLLEGGADPNYIDKGGTTAMDRALGMGSKRCVELLIRGGFNMGLADRDGNTFMTNLLAFRKENLHTYLDKDVERFWSR
eukprot:c11976_g1_i1 orf=148-3894(+)